MTRKKTVIKTPKDLARAIRTAKEKDVRACLLAISQKLLLDANKEGFFEAPCVFLNKDKDVGGADFIQEVSLHLEAYGFWPTEED